jgi:hypothetical protein
MAGPGSLFGARVRATVCGVFVTVEDLTGAVTGVLSPDGPLGMLTHILTNALDSVWAEFFSSPTPPGHVDWNAYSHQQLYDMLWQDADVGDVGAVAAEWGRHSTSLTEYADALRSEAAALRSSWEGRASELAADRLAELSDKIWNAGARAGTVEKAASDAGDALALARNSMPPPLPDPMTLMTSAVGAGPMPPLQAVLIGGARLFTGDAVAGVSKAEAVRVMQTYESSLRNSGNQVVPARPDATTSRTYGVDVTDGLQAALTSAAGVSGGGPSAGGGVPWSRLVGGHSPGPGGMVGAAPGPVQSVLAAENAALSNAAARRAMGTGGMFAPGMAPRSAEDEDKAHRNRLPNVDSDIFAPDQLASGPVIGATTDREQDFGV